MPSLLEADIIMVVVMVLMVLILLWASKFTTYLPQTTVNAFGLR